MLRTFEFYFQKSFFMSAAYILKSIFNFCSIRDFFARFLCRTISQNEQTFALARTKKYLKRTVHSTSYENTMPPLHATIIILE